MPGRVQSGTMKRHSRQPLTDRQHEVFKMIEQYIRDRHYPPTIREIGDAVGISSPNGVVGHLNALVKKCWIDRDPEVSRGMWIVD